MPLHRISIELVNTIKLDYPNIEVLNLSNNVIQQIENLGSLKTLAKLDLSRNHILRIQNIQMLLNIREINFSYNQIGRIEGMESLRQVTNINLSYNHLSNLGEVQRFKANISLEILDLIANPLTQIKEEAIEHLPQLKVLDNKEIKITEKRYVILKAADSREQTPSRENMTIQDVRERALSTPTSHGELIASEFPTPQGNMQQVEISSLKDIISMQDKYIHKRDTNSNSNSNSHSNLNSTGIVNRWRNKVFECLIQRKCLELELQNNNRNCEGRVKELKEQVENAIYERDLSNTKLIYIQNEGELARTQILQLNNTQELLIKEKEELLRENNIYIERENSIRGILSNYDEQMEVKVEELGEIRGMTEIYKNKLDKMQIQMKTLKNVVKEKIYNLKRENNLLVKEFMKITELLGINNQSNLNFNELQEVITNISEEKVKLKEKIGELEQKNKDMGVISEDKLEEISAELRVEKIENRIMCEKWEKEREELVVSHTNIQNEVRDKNIEYENIRIRMQKEISQLNLELRTQEESKNIYIEEKDLEYVERERKYKGKIQELSRENGKLNKHVGSLESESTVTMQTYQEKINDLSVEYEDLLKERDSKVRQLKSERDSLFVALNDYKYRRSGGNKDNIDTHEGYKSSSKYSQPISHKRASKHTLPSANNSQEVIESSGERILDSPVPRKQKLGEIEEERMSHPSQRLANKLLGLEKMTRTLLDDDI